MIKNKKVYLENFLLLFALIALYFLTAPKTIQYGDTGELVTNAFKFRTVHPPGYPLFIFINYLLSNLISYSTVFHRISLFQSCFAIIGIWFLFLIPEISRSFFKKLLIVTIFTTPLFWRMAILPDVFALHLCLFSFFLYCYFNNEIPKLWAGIAFTLAVSNQQISIFFLPSLMFIYVSRQTPWKIIIRDVLICAFVYSCIASLILAMNDKSLTSWGLFMDFEDLTNHLLRTEYGTFKLQHASDSKFVLWNNLKYFFKHFLSDYHFIFLLPLFFIFKTKFSSKQKFLLLNTIIYLLVFYSLSNIEITDQTHDTTERFLLNGFLVLLLLLSMTEIDKRIAKYCLLLILFQVIYNSYFSYHLNNYRNNNTIDLYFRRTLESLEPNSVLIINGDTEQFNLYYLLAIDNIRDDVLVLPAAMIARGWAKVKISYYHKYLNFKFETKENNEKNGIPKNIETFIRHNYKNRPLYLTNTSYITLEDQFRNHLKLTDHGFAYRIHDIEGGAISYDCTQENKLNSPLQNIISIQSEKYHILNRFFSSLFLCELRSTNIISKDDKEKLSQRFLSIFQKNPLNLEALYNLCLLAGRYTCRDMIQEELKHNYDYFDVARLLK